MIDWEEKEQGENGEILVFELTGRLDSTSCDYLYSVLENRVRDRCQRLIVDCHGLEFISSMGLGLLLGIHARMRKRGGSVSIARVRGAVSQVIQVVQLDKLFRIYPNVQSAIDSYYDK